MDFDLVSSYYTSFYTFDLVEDFSEDRYPTAREFYDMHLRYYRQYEDRITDDFVTLIENFDDHSVVHTRSGECYRARRVVISTAFRRKIHDSLQSFDFGIRGKTVVFDTIGDSANLMMAKLVTGDNRIVCLQNGFLALDKLFHMGDTAYSLDQLEAHQTAITFPSLYDAVIHFNFVRLIKILPLPKVPAAIMAFARYIRLQMGKVFTPHNFHVPFAHTRRGYVGDRPIKSQIPNGVIAIKYWPIDEYARNFSEGLPERIKEGYLLNDLLYFVTEGLVELRDKDTAKVNELQKTVECDGEVIHYDHYIRGDAEAPNLPRIVCHRDGEVRDYEYVYRHNYLGAMPKDLNGIYMLGYTRPLTGGLANITEMQSLFIHRVLTDEPYQADVRAHLDEKLDAYDRRYYPSSEPGPRDHVVFFGFYTEDVAKELGINLSFKDCRSFRDVAKYLTYPNNADKYRQKGRYAIDRCAELIDHVFTQHKGFALVWQLMATYVGYQVLTVAIAASLFFHGWIGGWALAGVAAFQYLFGYWAMIPVANSTPFFGTKLLSFLAYLPLLLDPRTALLILPLDFAITFALRQLPSARYPFNDLKNKPRYHEFYERYKEVYNQVRRPVPMVSGIPGIPGDPAVAVREAEAS